MAVDTRHKRFSIQGVSLPFRSTSFPQADGSVDTEDRQSLPYFYSGIAFASVTVIGGGKFVAGQVYSPGFTQGQSYSPGFEEGQTYSPGFKAGETN